jgi:inosine/xanthosine triphosphatase
MESFIVAVGSTRRPKLEAVDQALRELLPRFHSSAEFEIVSMEIPSGVRATPLSREESMAGARNRAEALAQIAREGRKPWNYFVGLEGGLEVIHEKEKRWVFLENWAYVADSFGRGVFGHSGGVLLPDALAEQVVDRGVDLSEAIDAYAKGSGIRDAQGAWGVLTRDIITRRDAFRISVIAAFSALLSTVDLRAGHAY